MLDPNEIVEIADHLLNTIVTTYGEHGVSLPESRYLAVGGQGTTVHEGEQVTVSFEQSYSGLPGMQAQEPVKCNSPRTAVFVIEIVRCIPSANTAAANPETPVPSRYGEVNTGVRNLSPETHTAVAKAQMVDAMLLMDAGLRAGETTLVGSITDVSAGAPQGGYQAISMVVTTSALTAMA